MTKRGKELNQQIDYEYALRKAEDIRPQGIVYKILAENGSSVGRLIYHPDKDELIVEIGSVPVAGIKGEYLKSISNSLIDLLAENEV